jgi:hypothetical protein
MKAVKRTVTIENPNELILTNLPFQQGQRVEVVLLADDEPDYRISEAKALFQATQALPQAKTITEDEITAEITAYRNENSY